MNDFKIKISDIKTTDEDALDLFYSGMKSQETKRTMDGNLRRFLVDVCQDILDGDMKERAKEFVDIARSDQERAMQIILVYTRLLKARTILAKNDKNYLNPSSVPNRIKPIKKLLDMSGVGLGWKRIYSTYPEEDNIHKGRGYTRDEIKLLLEHADGLATEFFILAACSGGMRVGAWSNLKWECVFPVYQENNEYAIESDKGVIVCAAMVLYKGTREEYISLISKEAWDKLELYKKEWTRASNRKPDNSDFLLQKFGTSPITVDAIRKRMFKLVVKAGLRGVLPEGQKRHEIPAIHGFRRFWDKVMMDATRKSDKLSSLVKKERLLGHDGIVKTDKNYYWTDILDLVSDYMVAMPDLTINDSERLRVELESEKVKNDQMALLNYEKDKALLRLDELEAKVVRMEKYETII